MKIHRAVAAPLIFFCCVLFSVSNANSQSASDRESLRGLSGVRMAVIVEDMAPEMERDGLTRQQVLTDVELKLRKVGIQVTEDDSKGFEYYLHVGINGVKVCKDMYAVSMIVQFFQVAQTIHTNKIMLVSTWESGKTGGYYSSQLSKIREELGSDLVDKFINDYLAANPTKAIR